MQVTINKKESTIVFEYDPQEEDNRYLSIEMEILRKLGYINSRLVCAGRRRLSQEPIRQFSEFSYQQVVSILKGYCLTPSVIEA